MRGIIEGLGKHIIETAAKADVLQRRLDFKNEKRQLDADKREWQRRLDAMETELVVEPSASATTTRSPSSASSRSASSISGQRPADGDPGGIAPTRSGSASCSRSGSSSRPRRWSAHRHRSIATSRATGDAEALGARTRAATTARVACGFPTCPSSSRSSSDGSGRSRRRTGQSGVTPALDVSRTRHDTCSRPLTPSPNRKRPEAGCCWCAPKGGNASQQAAAGGTALAGQPSGAIRAAAARQQRRHRHPHQPHTDRLVYSPPLESTGHVTFTIADLCTSPAGRWCPRC